MLRILRFIAEFVAAFVGVIVILSFLLIWRLSAKPISTDFMTPYIETGIENIVPGSVVKIADTLLVWDNVDHSILLHVDSIKVFDPRGHEIADVPTLRARVSVVGLLFGQFMPREMVIEHPQIKLERDKAGIYVFGGRAVAPDVKSSSEESKPIQEVLHTAFDNLIHTALMHRLAVTHAVVAVHDTTTQKDWTVGVPEISITRNGLREMETGQKFGSLDGRMTVEVTQKAGISSLDVNYYYDPVKERHSLSTTFTDLNPAFFAGGHPETLGLGIASVANLPMTGKVEVTLDKNLSFETAAGQIHGDEGELIDADLWDKPFPIKSFDANATYDRDAHTLNIDDTHVDMGGPTLDLKVKGSPPDQEDQDIGLAVFMTVDNMPMNRYGDVWPKPILPDPRYWLMSSLRDGVFKHAEVHLNGALAWNDLANLTINDGGGKLSATGARVTYLDGMPPAENVSANATFDLKKMAVQVTGGGIGNIRIQPFTLEISGLADPDQIIHIPLQVSGPVPEILSLLDHPPLGYAKALGISPADLQGKAEGTVDFRFPLLKTLLMKDVELHATSNVTGMASTKLVPHIAIDQGNFALTLDMNGFALKGQADLNKLPFQIAWHENFEEEQGKALRQINVTGVVKDNQWNNFGIHVFDGSKGSMPVTLEIKKPDKKKLLFTGTLDMTPAAMQIDMLQWKKTPGWSAVLNFSAVAPVEGDVQITNLDLRGDHIRASGNALYSSDMSQLLALDLPVFSLGRTNAALKFTQTYENGGALEFSARGASLDVSGLRGGNDPDKSDPRPKKYTIDVGKLYAGSVGEIDNARGAASRDQQGWRDIKLQGLANGDKPLSIELTPQPDGHRTFSITCDDFGGAMHGLGFTDTIKGGKLDISGQSTIENPRVIVGHVKINSFSIVKLPVLALLLNATSPFGFSGLLTNSADFSRFEGDFHWQGDEVTFTRAHAAGSAVGINIDGKIDMNSGAANLQGTLVPFSTVNKILNYIPLIGDLLTGGQDQGVLAVTYEINGTLEAPKVSVNPISLLTPGFIRNLFFSDDAADEKD